MTTTRAVDVMMRGGVIRDSLSKAWRQERGRVFAIAFRVAVILLLPYYAHAYSSSGLGTQSLRAISLLWTVQAHEYYTWTLSFRLYDILSVFQIALVMGPSLYFYLRQYHLQPSNTSAVLVTTIMSAAILSILAVMYSEPFYTDYGPLRENLAAELQACTVMSLTVFTIVPSMRSLALECLRRGDLKSRNRRRWEMSPGTVLALLAVFAPFTFYSFLNVNDILGFSFHFGSFAPAMTASGDMGWSLQPGNTDFTYLIGNYFTLPYPGVLYFLVLIWMVLSALRYVHSDRYRTPFRLSIIALLALYAVPLALLIFAGWATDLAQPPFPLAGVIIILWTRRMRSITVRGMGQGVDIAGLSDMLGGMGPAIEETCDPETKLVRVPVYYVVMSRMKRRRR